MKKSIKSQKVKPKKANMQIFSNNLKFLLIQKEITHLEFAVLAKVERHRVERWMKALCFPKYEMMVQICNFFGYYDIYKLITTDISAAE